MDRITDHPDMTSSVYSGRKATNQTNKCILHVGNVWLQSVNPFTLFHGKFSKTVSQF